MKTSIQAVVEISLRSLQSDKAANAWSSGANCCAICGKRIKEGSEVKYIHFLTNGNITSCMEDVENSQGLFPVGLECAKRLIIDFTTKISA